MIVRTRSHGGHRGLFYGCSGYHLRGRSVCENNADMPMTATDAAVLEELAEDLLNPKVIAAAIRRAVDRVLERQKGQNPKVALTRELQAVDREREHLVAAVKAGGMLPALLDALKDAERKRLRLQGEIAAQARSKPQTFDTRALEAKARAVVANWRTVLLKRQTHARRMIRQLLVGRLAFRQTDERVWTFTGRGTLRAILSGVVSEEFPNALASLDVPSWNQIVVFLQKMAQLREMAGSAA